MFPDFSRVTFSGLITTTLFVLALQQHPAAAQENSPPCGYIKRDGLLVDVTQDNDRLISAQFSTACARYYAPYAVMAAAAYLPVSKFEENRVRRQMSDAKLAVSALGARDAITDHAETLLRGWRYQFGSEGYIGCLHSKDAAYPEDEACKAALPNRLRRFIGSYTGPAFHVWAQRRRAHTCREVSIVFRGTMLAGDWLSDLRRFRAVDWVADEGYLQLNRNVDAIIGRIANLNCYNKQTTQIVSVGHSLGAGLAELTAFGPRPDGPRIAKVFAFNPSPETAYRLVDNKTLEANVGSKGKSGSSLEVDIVYHPGEGLEQVREIERQFPLGERCNPLVRTVRFDVNHDRGLIAQHSIRGNGAFAYGIVETSNTWGEPTSAPPAVSDCRTRYRSPQEQMVTAAPGRAIYARSGSSARTSGTSSYGLASDYPTSSEVGLKKPKMQARTGRTAPQRELEIAAMVTPNFAMTGYGH